MWLLSLNLAFAIPDAPFPRHGEDLVVKRYSRVDGDGPLRPRTRNANGPIEAWTFPDGTIEHYARYERRTLIAEHRFDATGQPLTTTRFVEGAPIEVDVHGAATTTVPVGSFSEHHLGGAALRAPGAPVTTGDVSVWASDEGWFRMRWLPASSDVFTDAFRDGLAAECACTLLDRTTAWIDGRPGVRYLVRMPDRDRPLEGEVWAVPTDGVTLLVSFLARHADGADRGDLSARMALGRAIVSMLRFEEAPEIPP
jgi:hypothetical protein